MNRDIKDDEIRVIGSSSKEPDRRPGHMVLYLVLGCLVIVVIIVCLVIPQMFSEHRDKKVSEDLENSLYDPVPHNDMIEVVKDTLIPLGDVEDSLCTAYTEHIVKTVNDIPLDIYIPHNAVPKLMLGVPDMMDKNIVLAAQAADIRADNGKIVGAFVVDGKPITWGLSKKGFCGIIDGKITVGVSENSPLFEEATATGGHFFRQYPLVDNKVLVENQPKGKSVRKALCDRSGEIFIAISQTNESFHDFAQALVDLNVDNAIYLVGSSYSYGFFRDKFAHLVQFSEKQRGGQKYENFIIWYNK